MRKLDCVFLLIMLWISTWQLVLAFRLNNALLRFQTNSNYVSNLNECMTKVTFHDWMFAQVGITDVLKVRYPDMFKY